MLKNTMSFKILTTSLILIILIFFTSFSQQVGHTQLTFTDSSRNNRSIPVEIFYPSQTAGNNVPVSAGIFPLIVFGHGFVMDWSAYQNFVDSLVPENYIIAFPTTESGLSPIHQDFADDLKFLVTTIKANGVGIYIPASSVATESAIIGHSMGGGCSFLAAENNSIVTTMVSFAAANTNPSSISASQNISIPTLIFSGTNDCVAPPSQHQDIMYDSCSTVLKTQIYISGGGHCYFANYNLYCSIGEGSCTPAPTISRIEQQDIVDNMLKLWLAFYLKGECNKAQEFQDSLLNNNRITFRQNQPISCINTIIENDKPESFLLFPNPSVNFLTIQSYETAAINITFYDAAMSQLNLPVIKTSDQTIFVDISSLSHGVYVVSINDKYRRLFIK
jgi:pimeloyl-ACP methyl ester carboxylesterase